MKTSSWRPSQSAASAAPTDDAFAVMTHPVRVYAHGASNIDGNSPVSLIGGLQLMLELIRMKIPATMETDSGEILLSCSADGSYHSVKSGILAALHAMDMARSAEYRRGYGEALDWMRQELLPAQQQAQPPAAGASVQTEAFEPTPREEAIPAASPFEARQPPAPTAHRPSRSENPVPSSESASGNKRKKGGNSDLTGLLR